MPSIICGSSTIPLPLVESLSWTKTAKTVTHGGGFVSARGFEACAISVRCRLSPSLCAPFGLDFGECERNFRSWVADRTAQSGIFYWGEYPIYPELEFALTGINRSFVYDATGSLEVEADLTFSGVRAVKNVFRQRALQIDTATTMPDVSLSVGGHELRVMDSFQITGFVTTPDAISLALTIGDDLDLVARSKFLTDLANGGEIIADLPQGKTRYYVISSGLVDSGLELAGSIYPPQAMQAITKTYQNTTLKVIIEDLARLAGIECTCLVDGEVSYYRAFNTPLFCIRELQQSAGFIMSYRAGRLTCADVPDTVSGQFDLVYSDMSGDTDREPVRGCYWYDGLHRYTSGTLDYTSLHVQSVFTSTEQIWAEKCHKFALYSANAITVTQDIIEAIDAHSAVTVRSNDAFIDGLVDTFELDWVSWQGSYEVHYPRSIG